MFSIFRVLQLTLDTKHDYSAYQKECKWMQCLFTSFVSVCQNIIRHTPWMDGSTQCK